MARTVLGGLVAAPLALAFRIALPKREHCLAFGISAFCGFIAFPIMFSIGQRMTSAMHGGLILAVLPIFTGLVAAAVEKFGRLDGLVNAAGLSDRGSVATVDPALFDRLFTVNTRAPMFLMQALIQHLQERKAPGVIVNVLSFQAHGAAVNLAIYGATKAALSLLTKNAAFAHRKDRIRIFGINLGWADTDGEREMQAVKLGRGESWLSEAEARMSWGRLIKPEDVASLTLFLLSDISIPMSGALIDQVQDAVLGVRD